MGLRWLGVHISRYRSLSGLIQFDCLSDSLIYDKPVTAQCAANAEIHWLLCPSLTYPLRMKEVEKSKAKRRFIARQIILFGGLFSLLGIGSLYHRYFGWELGFSSEFGVRAVAVLLFWVVVWFLIASSWWSQIPKLLAKKKQ